ncbi:MAG: hypothetical protein ABJP34_00410 [Erythrobacter sp.]
MRTHFTSFSLLAAASLLAACGGSSKPAEETKFIIDEDSGAIDAQIATDEGTATLKSGKPGKDASSELPLGFTVFPGADVVSNTTFEQKDKTVTMISLASDVGPGELVDHYRKQAEAAGIAIKLEMSVNDGQMIGGDDGKGKTFSLDTKKVGAGMIDPDLAEMDEDDKELQAFRPEQETGSGDEEASAAKTTATLTLSGDFSD